MSAPSSAAEWKPLGRFEIQLAGCETELHQRIGLSPREWQTLKLIADGQTSPEIAHRLNVQRSTIDTFKKRIFEKLEVNSAVEASSLAMALLSGVRMRERELPI